MYSAFDDGRGNYTEFVQAKDDAVNSDSASQEIPYGALPDSGFACYSDLAGVADQNQQSAEEKSRARTAGEPEFGFDEEFQKLVADIREFSILQNHLGFEKLSRLVQDFHHTALTYGKVIIAEKNLPDERKSIKPVQVGGYAGGEKFLCGNVFFRFPVDKHGLYGSDEFAMKEANHQLKGLTALYNTRQQGLYLPLLGVVRYLGFKLVAVSALPIKRDTLCYGSSDAMKTFADASGQDIIEAATRMLNLCSHPVRSAGSTGSRWIPMPCDMELHRVTFPNGNVRHYAVDFQRLFPAQPPGAIMENIVSMYHRPGGAQVSRTQASEKALCSYQSTRSDHLVYMLRPELVQSAPKALSSDAFSRFASSAPEHVCFNKDVEEATQRLVEEVIPRAAKEISDIDLPRLHKLHGSASTNEKSKWQVGVELTYQLHRRGVNMRFLGLVYDHILPKKWKREVILEACARVVKAMVQSSMRKAGNSVRTAVLSPRIDAVASELNGIFGRLPCRGSGTQPCPCLGEHCGQSGAAPPSGASEETAPALMQKRANFWCVRIKALLVERFWFMRRGGSGRDKAVLNITNMLTNLESSIYPPPSCLCCPCLWKRCVEPARLFARVQLMCNIEVNPSLQRDFSLRGNSDVPATEEMDAAPSMLQRFTSASSSTTTISSTVQSEGNSSFLTQRAVPFQKGYGVQDLGASVRMLPIMEYAQGSNALCQAIMNSRKMEREEISFFLDVAQERLTAGLRICSWDTDLLINLGTVEEERGLVFEALRYKTRAVSINPRALRGWFSLARGTGRLFSRGGKDVSAQAVENKCARLFGVLEDEMGIQSVQEITKRGVERMKSLLALLKESPDAKLVPASLKLDANDLDQALEDDPLQYFRWISFVSGCFDRALESFKVSWAHGSGTTAGTLAPVWLKEWGNFFQHGPSSKIKYGEHKSQEANKMRDVQSRITFLSFVVFREAISRDPKYLLPRINMCVFLKTRIARLERRRFDSKRLQTTLMASLIEATDQYQVLVDIAPSALHHVSLASMLLKCVKCKYEQKPDKMDRDMINQALGHSKSAIVLEEKEIEWARDRSVGYLSNTTPNTIGSTHWHIDMVQPNKLLREKRELIGLYSLLCIYITESHTSGDQSLGGDDDLLEGLRTAMRACFEAGIAYYEFFIQDVIQSEKWQLFSNFVEFVVKWCTALVSQKVTGFKFDPKVELKTWKLRYEEKASNFTTEANAHDDEVKMCIDTLGNVIQDVYNSKWFCELDEAQGGEQAARKQGKSAMRKNFRLGDLGDLKERLRYAYWVALISSSK